MRNNQREHFCNGEYCQVKTFWSADPDWNDDGDFVSGWRCNNCGRWEAKRVQKRNYEAHTKPNRSQQAAIDHLRSFIERDISDTSREKYGQQIVKFEVEPTGYDYGFWVSVEVDMVNLDEGNLLRALDWQSWHVYVGARGRLDAHSYPDVYKRCGYKGKRHWSGINFK